MLPLLVPLSPKLLATELIQAGLLNTFTQTLVVKFSGRRYPLTVLANDPPVVL